MTIDKLLDESDRIQNLSDDAIVDVWVRKQLFSKFRRRIMRRGRLDSEVDNPLNSKHYNAAINQLKIEGSGSIFNFVREHFDLQDQTDLMNGSGLEDKLFEKLTNSDLDKEEKIEMCKKDLAKTTQGCGMPIHEIVRDNISSWEELES